MNASLNVFQEVEFASKRAHLSPVDDETGVIDVRLPAATAADQAMLNRRSSSAILEIALLLSALVKMNVRTLAFCKVCDADACISCHHLTTCHLQVRRMVELVLKICHDDLRVCCEC